MMVLSRLSIALLVLCAGSVLGADTALTNQPAAARQLSLQSDTPPFALTLTQARHWQPNGPTADARNISQVALAKRFSAPLQPGVSQDEQALVLYAPDGMNNFANYLSAQPQFNLYNFSNWQHIDVLNWFAGTADLTVQIPARPWVDAAHKNGVKVLGSVFFGMAQWGGNPATLEALLEQTPDGRFVIADQLLRMAAYYGFDGWLINQETDLTAVKDGQNQLVRGARDPARGAALARRLQDFMAYLTAKAPAGIEIHWYDAMITDGTVRWQNALNEKNLPYLQQGKVGAPDSERRADAIFLNYWWHGAMLRQSRAQAEQLGLSRYQLYSGVDLWPERDAQQAFVQSRWLSDWFDASQGQAHSSLALFAPNVNFNFSGTAKQPAYSRFASDSADVQRFYATEQRLFVGDDGNLASRDQRWPGIGAVLPAKTALTSLPFQTHFNTGQGRFWFVQGQLSRPPFAGDQDAFRQGWTDISQQDWLPTWQFALEGEPAVVRASTVQYDFHRAWQGGSSLYLKQNRPGALQLPLYQFALQLPASSRLQVRYQSQHAGFSLLLQTHQQSLTLPLPAGPEAQWQLAELDLSSLQGQPLHRLSLIANPGGQALPASAGTSIRLGAISITERQP